MKSQLLLFYFLISTISFSQSFEIRKEIDSLKYEIAIAKHDSLKIQAYVAWQNLIFETDPDLDYELNERIIEICLLNLQRPINDTEKLFFKTELSYAYNIAGNYFEIIGNYPKAIESLNKSLKIAEDLQNLRGIANANNNLGNSYRRLEEQDKAIVYYEKAVVYWKKIEDQHGLATTYNNLGLSYSEKKIFDKAKPFLDESKQLFLELDDKSGLGLVNHNIGQLFIWQNQNDSALIYFQKSLELYREVGTKSQIASNLRHISIIAFNEALAFKKSGDQKNYSTKLNEADQLANESLHFSENSSSLEDLRLSLQQVYLIQKEKEEYRDAFFTLEKYIEQSYVADSLENRKLFFEQSYKAEYNAKYERDSLLRIEEKKLNQVNLEKERVQKYSLYGGLILLLIFIGFIYNRFKITNRQKNIIEEQKDLVEEKQKEILDSINYAKRIQNAILPSQRVVTNLLPEHFILYLPKDIVAGDFYWMESVNDTSNPKNHAVLFAAADCTGHGVPGAMVSVVCNNSLNRSVREYGLTDPGKILDKTREIVVQEFEKSDEDVKDGMDISLCSLSLDAKTLSWAGANNPLWIIRNSELIEFKPDKQPIGKIENPKSFATQTIQLQKGDSIYIFTDGLQDQFGGEKGKKFKASKLKEILLSMQQQPLPNQKETLKEAFINWKGRLEQVDDVCVIGVRI
ncbi:MAG: tetratricopeptide repeat protein [Crocinitomicaceae bacterium]|nr:tetratricopeptide repeat protein [Crocinitomicaceae bacterium]